MSIFRKPNTACSGSSVSRSPRRALLRRAAKGETDAYVSLTRSYFDLICEHLYLCNFDRGEILRETELLLREGWERLPYLKRLSDWEYFLARRLAAIEVSFPYSREGRRPQALVELDRRSKFALIAFDLENWDYPWLSLALRVSPKELRKILFEARCKLLRIDLKQTNRTLRRHLSIVSADFDGQLKPSQQRQALRWLCSCEQTKAFKSGWLDYRCQLIEIRQQIRLQEDERDIFLDRLGRNLTREQMLRPSLFAKVRNLFSFQEIPLGKAMAGQRHFSFDG